MPRKLFLIGLGVAFCFGKAPDCHASRSSRDYLVPVQKALGLSAAYEELWRQKLLVTPGEIARFVGLPGTVGVETTISVYREPGKEGSLPGNYWVTATQASERLWNCVESGDQGQVDPNTITVKRCDAPVGESTALVMQKIWLAMLSQSRPQRQLHEIPVDSSREIFSAEDSEGRVLQGESSTAPKENTKALISIALSLLEYCGADVLGRATIAADIEKAASNLLERVALRSISTGRNPRSTASSKATVSLRKQSISRPTAGRKPAKLTTRLGSSIDDFRSRWGTPVRGVVLARTTRLVWKPVGRKSKALPMGICEAEVSFLDRIACEIVLRSKQPLTKRKSVKLAKMVVPNFRASDLATHKSRSGGCKTYALSSGGYMITYRKPAVIVTRSPLFLQNNRLFAQQAASVRPPTVGH